MPNSITIEGRLGQDATLKYTQAGNTPILDFSLACNTGYGDKKKTTWFRCAMFGKRAETLQAYLTKGVHLCVTGEMYEDSFTNRDGAQQKQIKCTVNDVWLLSKGEGRKDGIATQNGKPYPENASPVSFDSDEDVPF